MLVDRIKEDTKSSLKAGDQNRVATLRMLISEINNKAKEKQAKGEEAVLNNDEAVAVLQKESKKKKDAIDLFKRGNRNDLAEIEDAEIKIIGIYLPEQAGEDEISAVVEKIVAQGGKDFGAVMREAMNELKGKADGKLVGEIVKKKLG